MRALLRPSRIAGIVDAPQSKSYAIRYIMSSTLAHIELLDLVLSRDVVAATEAVEALNIKRVGTKFIKKDPLRIVKEYVYLGGSATTLRMFIPIVTVVGGEITIDGDYSLRRRPINAVIDALADKGVKFSSTHLPTTIEGKLRDPYIEISGSESSQYISGFMIAFALVGGGTIKIKPPIVSRNYIHLTSSILKQIGADVRIDHDRVDVEVREKLCGYRGRVPGDYLLASFYVASALLTGGHIKVRNLPSPSGGVGDHVVVSIYRDMGAYSEYLESYWHAEASESYRAIEIDVEDSPDLALSVAAIASVAKGKDITRIKGVERLRIKESDRITETINMLKSFGVRSYFKDDSIYICGGMLRKAHIACPDDHRIAMTATPIALKVGGSIDKAECVNKSNPLFWMDLIRLEGDVVLEG